MSEQRNQKKHLQRRQESWVNPFEEMSRLFDGFFGLERFNRAGRSFPQAFEGKTPKVDLVDKGNAFFVRAELPGVAKEDLHVSVTEDSITIHGESKQEKEEKEEGKYYFKERSFGSFSRTLPLPEAIDGEKVKATFENGLLTVHLAKVQPVQQRRINID